MNKFKMLAAAALIGAMGFASAVQALDKGLVGISMPTQTTARWSQDGESLVKYLKEKGFATDLQNANDDVANQTAQIEKMIDNGAKAVVIGAIDGSRLSDVLQKAADKGVKVISYDRMITKTKNVDYYTTFDNFNVGVLQANSLVDALKLKDGKGPFNIELFAGSPDDTNADFFYDGAMSILKPYIDSGMLVVRSGQTKREKISMLRWNGVVARARTDRLMASHYRAEKLDAVLAPNDELARGVIDGLKRFGYCTPSVPCPFVTGQDAEIDSVKSIINNEQYSTVFKDTRELAKVTAALVDAVLSGKQPEINDKKTYNNGVKVLDSYLLKPVSVDKTNYKAVLVDSGYISADKLK